MLFTYNFGYETKNLGVLMEQLTLSVKSTPPQSVESVTLSAVAVEYE